MADYIKPFICDHKGNSDKLKEKHEHVDEEKPLVRSGMGDFDYENHPLAAMGENLTDTDLLDQISNKTKRLLVNMDNQIAENFEERRNLDYKLADIEKEMEKRKRLYDMCLEMSKEGSVAIERYSEKIRVIDTKINYVTQLVESWQSLIDDFRKIPDECE